MSNAADSVPTVRLSSRNVTVDEGGRRKWIYSDLPRGRFARARNVIYSILIVFYIAAPFLSVGSQPFLRFDLPARRFSIFGTTFVATDFYLLALLLLIAAVAMFLFSALLGRLWCGWACPQTVYLEGVFRRIERWIEGTPLQRRKLDDSPRTDVYWAKKIFKHTLFIGISLLLSLAFVAYFVSPRGIFEMLSDLGRSHPAAMVTTLVVGGLTYWNFSWFREQFCTFLCPYARFQAVMLDDHSLIVGYDPKRGEPRGSKRPDESWEGRGDCIDCKRCVQVCPTGIDIRNGLQLECVSCTACIDACDEVMERVGRPRGLIRYDSLAGIAGRPRHVVRRRVILYAAVMILVLGVFTSRLMSRDLIGLTVARAPGLPYMVQDDERVRNMFVLNVTNTDATTQTVTFEVEGAEDIEIIVPGQPLTVPSGERIRAEAFVLVPDDEIKSTETPITFRLMSGLNVISTAQAFFLGPIHSHEKKHGDHDEDSE